MSAALLFALDEIEREELANRAGYSFLYGTPDAYSDLFQKRLLGLGEAEMRKVKSSAGLSERMFYLMRTGRVPSKESAIAMALTLDLSYEQVNAWIGSAGYCLSKSIPSDRIIAWFLENQSPQSTSLIRDINEQLHQFGLPLLMTRISDRVLRQ